MLTCCFCVAFSVLPPLAVKIVGFAGYGSYLTALSYPIYLQLGGAPKGQPRYDAGVLKPTSSSQN